MKNFTVLRFAKINNNSSMMSGLDKHNDRKERDFHVENADPSRTHLNEKIIGGKETIREAINSRIETGHTYTTKTGKARKIRTDACRAVEVVMSASPEQLSKIEKEGRLDEWKNESMNWMKNEFGEKNIVKAYIHLDEETPHIHAIIVPIAETERGGNLSHKHFFDGKQKMRDYQTSYSDSMKGFDLQRGVAKEVTRSKHQSIKQFNKKIKEPTMVTMPDFRDSIKTENTGGIFSKKKEVYSIEKERLDAVMRDLLSNEISLTEREQKYSDQKEKLVAAIKDLKGIEKKLKQERELLDKEKKGIDILQNGGLEKYKQAWSDKNRMLREPQFYKEQRSIFLKNNTNQGVQNLEQDIDDMRRKKRRSRGGIT